MSKGYPDYFGFSIFPQHGSILHESVAAVVASNANDVIINISEKGELVSSQIYIGGAVSHRDDIVSLTIDGILMSQTAFGDLLIAGGFIPRLNSYFIRSYYERDFLYIMNGLFNFSYISSVSLSYHNKSAESITVYASLNHYKVM